jgi:hypothetical protein
MRCHQSLAHRSHIVNEQIRGRHRMRTSIRDKPRTNIAQIDALIIKLAKGAPQPNITIGIHHGQVQWARGNPFPIRICDYDGFDLPDVDKHGKPCEIWLEPPDKKVKRA